MKRLALMAVLGGVVVAAAAPGHRSLTSSMVAAAMSRFRGVKDGNVSAAPKTVATAVVVAGAQGPIVADVVPAKKDGPVTADVTPTKKPDQGPIVADVVPAKKADQGPITADVIPAKKSDQGPITADVTPAKPSVASTPPVATKPGASKAGPNGMVTNLFVDTDIKSVINDVASLAGVTIIADDTIKEQSISIEFKNEPVDSVVEKLALVAGAYSKQQSPGVYLISKATVDSAFFSRFAETRIYNVRNQTAVSIQALLSLAFKPYLSFDPKTNTIGICAPKPLMEKILADIEKADRPGRQIYVEALVTEISAEDSLGTSFSGASGKWSLGSTLAITTQAAGFAQIAQIQALLNNHKMKLRANPHLIATAGQEATVNVGQDTYYSLLSGSTIYPTSQIQLIHTGVVLKFTGTIGDDGLITMQLDPSVSDAVVSVNGNPTSNIRTASTRIRVKSGDTIVIAGLVQETSDRQVVRVPILGYLPLVGELFTQRNYDKKKVETVFLITPRILDGP